MSINPVQSGGAPAPELTDARPVSMPDRAAAPDQTGASRPTDLGPSPRPEEQSSPDADSSFASPQDEVEVQRENGINGEIVIRYLDRQGDVVLQVPSSEVLDLARSIEQDLGTDGASGRRAGALKDKGEKASGN